jgi:hypothetical protein
LPRRTNPRTGLAALGDFRREDVRVKFIIGDGLGTEGERRRDGVVFFAKSDDDVVDKFIIGERGTAATMISPMDFICYMYWAAGIPSLRRE